MCFRFSDEKYDSWRAGLAQSTMQLVRVKGASAIRKTSASQAWSEDHRLVLSQKTEGFLINKLSHFSIKNMAVFSLSLPHFRVSR
jgi:hypothetical protein